MSEAEMQAKVRSCVQGRDLGLLGEPRVNVLLLNLAVDTAKGRQ
jgi:K+-transporting ATPase ATPase C chain